MKLPYLIPFNYCTIFILVSVVASYADKIGLADSMFAEGDIRVVTTKYIKFHTSNTGTLVKIPTEKIDFIEMKGIKYVFNKERNRWDMVVYTDVSDKVRIGSIEKEVVGIQGDISICKYKAYEDLYGDKESFSRSDSVYRENFYELCYKGDNFELIGEKYDVGYILGFNDKNITRFEKNPYPSGEGGVITGFIFLGVGLFQIGVVTIAGFVSDEGHIFESFVPGMIGCTVAGIVLPINLVKKKRHNKWKKRYQ